MKYRQAIFCQEESYLLELVRYIHLKPLRAKLVADMDELGRDAYCGHSVLMGKVGDGMAKYGMCYLIV